MWPCGNIVLVLVLLFKYRKLTGNNTPTGHQFSNSAFLPSTRINLVAIEYNRNMSTGSCQLYSFGRLDWRSRREHIHWTTNTSRGDQYGHLFRWNGILVTNRAPAKKLTIDVTTKLRVLASTPPMLPQAAGATRVGRCDGQRVAAELRPGSRKVIIQKHFLCQIMLSSNDMQGRPTHDKFKCLRERLGLRFSKN